MVDGNRSTRHSNTLECRYAVLTAVMNDHKCKNPRPRSGIDYIRGVLRGSPLVAHTLAAKAPYPAALEDCYLVLKWMKENAQELGINPNQLFVGGDSAGGGLTAAVCLYARDKGEVNIAYQMPLYPMLDDRMITASSQNNDAPVRNTASNEAAWALYLDGIEEVPIYAAPSRADNLRNLPPACTYVGTIEPFHDETVDLVNRLRELLNG